MNINEIRNELKKLPLTGELTSLGGTLKWKYDAFARYNGNELNNHLEEIYLEDKEMIEESLVDMEIEYILSVPEYEDSWVFFHIENE